MSSPRVGGHPGIFNRMSTSKQTVCLHWEVGALPLPQSSGYSAFTYGGCAEAENHTQC